MANKKLTDLTELITPADNDFLYIVDVSDTTESAQGTSKKIRKDKVDSGASKENIANKQNDLTIDGTGTKYPTVDATIAGLAAKQNVITGISSQNIPKYNGGFLNSNLSDLGTLLNSIVDIRANGVTFGRGNGGFPSNTVMGASAGFSNVSGVNFLAQGFSAAYSNLSATNFVSTGYQSSYSITSGKEFIALGFQAARFLSDSVTPLTNADGSIFIGTGTKAKANNSINELVVGNKSTGLGDNTSVFGNVSTLFGRWRGKLLVGKDINNDIDDIQANGTVSFSAATLPNQGVIKSQIDVKANLDNTKKITSYEINNSDGNLGQFISENLAETVNYSVNFIINTSNGTLSANTGYTTTDYIDVVEGFKYKHQQVTGGGSVFGAWYDVNNVFISGISVAGPNVLLTAPFGAKKIRVSYTNVSGLNNFYFYKSFKLSSYGDSITFQNTWQPLLAKYLNAHSVVIGYGGYTLTGTGTSSLNQDTKLATIPTDSDIITIMAGTNDWSQNVPLGGVNSTNINEFYGALNYTFTKLKANNPNAIIIALATPYGEYPDRDIFTNKIGIINNEGLSTLDYANAVIEAAKNHNIRFVRTDNLWGNRNISEFVTYDTAYLHPNASGGKLLASKISLDIVQDIIKKDLKTKANISSPTFTGTTTIPIIVSTNVVRLKNYTVATLPVGVRGDTAYVTDALTPTYLGALVGGGAVVTPVFYNGTTWVSH